jgi:hypothetical protein
MKKQLVMFILIQMLFLTLFSLLSTSLVQPQGLQPLNSIDETIHVNLNETANVKDIQSISHEHGLNIAYFDSEKDAYYVDFSLTSNPERIYGVPTHMFLHESFTGAQCASTDEMSHCSINLSTTTKTKNITIYPFSHLSKETALTNIILYPDKSKTREEQGQPFKNKYPKSGFVASIQTGDQLLPILVIIFIFCNVLILLSLLQTIYRASNRLGLNKLMGKSFVRTCMLPLITRITIIGIILLVSYISLHTWLTSDWSYLRFIAFYCAITFLLYSSGLSVSYVSVNRQRINSLIKGMQKSRLLIRLFVLTSFVSLFFSGILLPILSAQIRGLHGLYKNFAYYEKTLEQAGTILMTPTTSEAFAAGNAEALAHQNKIIEYFGSYIYSKHIRNRKYLDKEEFYPIIDINKNLVNKYFEGYITGLNLDNLNNVYIFTSDSSEQQLQIDDIKQTWEMPGRPIKVEIVNYNNPQLKEFVEDKEAGPQQYHEISRPIYIYNPRAEQMDMERGVPFTSRYGLGLYIDLESAEASRKWENLERQLEAWGIAQYYEKPVTLAATSQELIQTAWIFIGTISLIFIFSLFGVIILIQTWLQEYFRMNRKRLILEKVFGRTFLDRYVIFLITTLYVLTKYQIIRLERASTNIVIKE